MHSYISLTNSLGSTLTSQVHGRGCQTMTDHTNDECLYLSLNPVQPLYSATPNSTPTSHTSSGIPIVHANWWVCCHCDSMNNPDLAPDRCSICQHYKCAACNTAIV